ncbi:glycoside hydrolase domain-containing protein [Fundicoccus culcitae]|uniref:DUF4091 domain-containing protein n=1 Tax=Fundicoccus culcitae TaxID=2969821 RepID=A0ABY5P959_9LACT|nr:glycoside hydrolase domain-containing protein [Fundicoccus culcitae]UUX35289.1 DUF4091 domain-containing protein [Fundicoccus culcitae]
MIPITYQASQRPLLHVTAVSSQQAFTQADYGRLIAARPQAVITESVWRNDQLDVQFAILTRDSSVDRIQVSLKALSFNPQINTTATPDDKEAIPVDRVQEWFKIYMVKEVDAYAGFPGHGSPTRPLPIGNRRKAAEVLVESDTMQHLPAKHLQAVWLQAHIPEEVPAGQYQATLAVVAETQATQETQTITINFEVLDAVLADPRTFKNTFDIELWQNPYAVAEYYEVEPFSEEHFAILKPHMQKYQSIGGNAITTTIVEEAWNGQTYSKHETKFPSMVKWTKTTDNTYQFDYTDFDKWVSFNRNLGLGQKIVCYTMAPWTNQVVYYDQATQQQQAYTIDVNDDHYATIWTAFLEDFMAHTLQKGWKDAIQIGIDERGFDPKIFEVVEAVTDSEGKPFKVAGAMDSIVSKRHFNKHITDLSVGTIPIKESTDIFKDIIEERKQLNLKTSVYSCTGHSPGNFSLNAPAESYWTIIFAYAAGAQGFLRWAYDSWVEDPLRDTTHNAFEAGDTFLIFPSEKGTPNPQPQSSLRLEKLAQGVRDVNKLLQLAQSNPATEVAVGYLLEGVKRDYPSEGYYLTATSKQAIISDMETFRINIHALTKQALSEGNVIDPRQDASQWEEAPLAIPDYLLPDAYVSTIDKPTDPDHSYLGQPDMIALPDEQQLLVTYPIGHGAGPIVLQKSLDGGESWERQKTPASWAISYETPTLYRLDFTDGSCKLVLISGRPNWKGNTVGGWQMSVSDDLGESWTEFETYHPLYKGQDHWTIVPMASLVQVLDADQAPTDRWLGVYHDYNFVNYATYLTFDAATGQPQWSEPVPYLQDYRQLEAEYQICEVGLFRSPDQKTISALGRTQSHRHSSVVFHSHDEGVSWSEPQELPLELWGERHKAKYDPVSGRLLITFRQMIQLKHTDPAIIETDWLAGDWMLWVGTYQDILALTPGEYRITLIEDWTMSRRAGDTGYAGFVTQSDGTLILASYGHWDKTVSQAHVNDTLGDLCYIKQVKFKLADIERNFNKGE